MTIRIIGLTQGTIQDPLAASGLNQNVFSALARHTDLVSVLDISFHGWKRWWNAFSHWHPDRDRWRERFDLNIWSFQQLSRIAGHKLSLNSGKFDMVFQLKALFAPGIPIGRWPFVLMVDNTYALSDRYYPPWAPLTSKEKKRWLALERETYHRSVAVFARTEWVRQSLIEDYGLPPEQAVWVGTGSHFELSSIPDRKEVDDGRTILFVGKEVKRKGVYTLIEAFKMVRQRYSDARLVIVGRDIPVHLDGVEILGKVTNRNTLRQLYAQASVFVLPAVFEPCGNVITEAMAYRLPCIVSTAGGIAELVEDQVSGYVIPPQQPVLLANRILDLLSDPQKRRRMGEEGLRRVKESLNWDSVVMRMLPYLSKTT